MILFWRWGVTAVLIYISEFVTDPLPAAPRAAQYARLKLAGLDDAPCHLAVFGTVWDAKQGYPIYPHGIRCGAAPTRGAGSSSRSWNTPPIVST
jgi:hypothetical protein